MKSSFSNRRYPKTIIDTEVSRVKFFNTSGNKRTKTNGIPLVITYHPLLKDFVKVLNKHLHLLYMNDEVKKHLLLIPWFHFGKREIWAVIWSGQKSLGLLNVMVSVFKYAWMWQKVISSIVQFTRESM